MFHNSLIQFSNKNIPTASCFYNGSTKGFAQRCVQRL